MNKLVSISLEDGVANVRLARAEKMNALSSAMFNAVIEAGERLKSDGSVRAVVLSGGGARVLRRSRCR